MCGRGIRPSGSTYDEVAAAQSGIVLERGCELMPRFFAN
jgi:hypothetical protein